MGDLSLIGFVIAITIIGFLFHFLSWIYNFFFNQNLLNSGLDFNSRRDYEVFSKKKEFYECGFKSTIDINIQLSLQFPLIAVFFIIYDIELVFLMPIFLNYLYMNLFNYVVYILFVYIISLSFYYEWKFSGLDWQF